MAARSYTRAQIRARIRARANQPTTGNPATDFIPDTMLDDWIDSALGEYWDELDDLSDHLFLAEQAITTADATGVIALPADHLRTIGIDYLPSSDTPVELQQVHFAQRNDYGVTGSEACAFYLAGDNIRLLPAPPSGQSYRHTYVPGPPKLADDSATIPGYSGLEEFVVQRVCADCAMREEGDPTLFMARAREVLERIRRRITKRTTAGGLQLQPGSIWRDPEAFDPDWNWRSS